MSSITTFNPSQEYVNALLCKVAYEYLPSGFNLNDLSPSNFSADEIAYLQANYKVIDGLEASNGFDGTWLARIDNLGRQTGEAVFTIAGTDPGWGIFFDIDDDYHICKKGIATEQFIEAYNYYMRMANSQGSIINQIIEGKPESGAYLKIPNGDSYKYYTVIEMSNTNRNGGFSNISITGHSLGGHLAGLLGIITGNKTTIFNAPSYFKNPIGDYSIEYVFIDNEGIEHSETLSSDYLGFVEKFFGNDLNQSSITHIYNSNNLNVTANLGWNWITNKGFDCLNQSPNISESHSIVAICDAYHTYEVIKGFITNSEMFTKNIKGTDPQIAFENLYKLFCLETGQSFSKIEYSSSSFQNTYLNPLKAWLNEQTSTNKPKNILADVFNVKNSSSVQMGTEKADIIYSGGGNDTINTYNGTDIVDGGSIGSIYGSDVSGDTNTINLGGGNDFYYGGEGKDIVHGGTGRDSLSGLGGKNELYGESGDDYLYGGDENNKLDAGTGRDVIYTSGKGINNIYLGNDLCSDLVMVGGTGVDHIYQATESDYFYYGAGIASTMNSGKDYMQNK